MTVRRRDSASPLDRGPTSAELAARVGTDPLTGLLTRQALFEVFSSDDGRSNYAGVLIVKVARFRRINSLYGQRYGDRCLIEMADWLRASSTTGDVLARTSGNEFTIVYREGSPVLAEVSDGAQRLLQVGPKQIEVTVQGGWAQRSGEQSLSSLFQQAETAGAVAEHRSSPALVKASDALSAGATERLGAEEIVRGAILGDGLTIAFQPVVDISSAAVHSVEALARLRVGEGRLSAERVVGLGRDLGLGMTFAQRIFELAFGHFQHLNAVMPNIKLAVNVSREVLGSGRAIEEIARAASAAGVSLRRVIVEMTEDVAEGVSDTALRSALSLGSQAGMDMVVDDFGRGETSLSLIRSLPVAAIKLDRSLVAAEDDDEGWRFLDGVIKALHVLTPRLIAEGVETSTQSQRLVQLGVSVQQGYLFGRPQPYRYWLEHEVLVGE